MVRQSLPHQPTLRNLLASEAMSEVQLVYGQDLLDRPVIQVVTSLVPPPRAGSLLVTRISSLTSYDDLMARELAGIVVITPYAAPQDSASAANLNGVVQGGALATVSLDVELEKLVQLCTLSSLPLFVVPGFGEGSQPAEDIRLAFLGELRRASASIHARLLSLVLSEGLLALVEEVGLTLNRPVAVETVDFKILAAKNMGPTPPSQQRTLTEEIAESLNRLYRSHDCHNQLDVIQRPFRIGRRLVVPILLNGVVVGYLSVTVRPTDDIEAMSEYLQPAALAAMVDFSQRLKNTSTFSVTQKSLLKDLLAGRALSAADQERLEQAFGFDLCDGLLVFAVQEVPGSNNQIEKWPEEPYASVEFEGTRVYVLAYHRKSGRTWQQEAEAFLELLKNGKEKAKVQLGVSRLTESTLDLPDSYREARQALVIGSMIHGDNDFVVGYGDLGVKRLLYLMIDHPELERFYEENLAPLEAYDVEWETELVSTLKVYLKEGANLNSAARALFIHRHTLRYRLEQIAEILNVDIDSQEVLLNLQIAYLIREMKGKLLS